MASSSPRWTPLLACATFMAAGPILILINSHILNKLKFNFPILLSAFGVAFSALACRLLVALRIVHLQKPELTRSNSFCIKTTIPLALLAASSLAFGNASYVHLGVGMCQMLKSLTPVMTLLLLRILGLEHPTKSVILCVLVMAVGTSIAATNGELAVSHLGLVLQLSANLVEACRVTLSQRLLASQRFSLPLVEMQYHVAPWQTFFLLAASALFEVGNKPGAVGSALEIVCASPRTFVLASVLGFSLQVLGLSVIRTAGSLTMKLLTISRNGGLVLFQAISGAESFEPAQLAGHTLSTMAFIIFTTIKLRDASLSMKKLV